METHYLYILKSKKDGNLYIGITNDLNNRLSQHNKGRVKSTKNRRPFNIVYSERHESRKSAAKREWLLKNSPGAGKKKKELIKNYNNSCARSSTG